MNLLELSKEAIAIDSTPKHGNLEIAEFYAKVAQDLGFQVDLQHEIHLGIEQALLVVTPPSVTAERHFLMFSQLDTPSAGDYVRWTKTGGNPFATVVSDEHLHGLGVARGKLDFLIKLQALKELKDIGFNKLCPVLIGSFGEETGSAALRLIRKKTFKPVAGVVAAPTDMKISVKGPGYAILEVFVPFSEEEKLQHKRLEFEESITTQTRMFTVKQQLGSYLEHEEGPIGQMLEYLKNLPEGFVIVSMSGGERPTQRADSAWLELQIYDGLRESIIPKLMSLKDTLHRFTGELRSLRDNDFSPNHSTINLGSVRTRPDGIRFMCSCRFVSAVSKDQNLKWLNDFEKECEQKGAKFQLLEYREPFHAKENASLIQSAAKIAEGLHLPTDLATTQWCSDANVLNRFGIESFVIGAGNMMPNDPAGNENLSLKKMDQMKAFYKRLLEANCV